VRHGCGVSSQFSHLSCRASFEKRAKKRAAVQRRCSGRACTGVHVFPRKGAWGGPFAADSFSVCNTMSLEDPLCGPAPFCDRAPREAISEDLPGNVSAAATSTKPWPRSLLPAPVTSISFRCDPEIRIRFRKSRTRVFQVVNFRDGSRVDKGKFLPQMSIRVILNWFRTRDPNLDSAPDPRRIFGSWGASRHRGVERGWLGEWQDGEPQRGALLPPPLSLPGKEAVLPRPS